jgi:hypothetical protein
MEKYTKGFWRFFFVDSGHWKAIAFVLFVLIVATSFIYHYDRSWDGLVFLIPLALLIFLVLQHYNDRKNGRSR